MHKTDSMDFTNRVKLLLELMKNNSAEESQQSDEEEYSDDSDVSDTEQEDKDEDYAELKKYRENFQNGHNYDRTFRLNKFFEDQAKKKGKLSTPPARHTIWDNFQFKEKMYRVIPIRLDQKVYNSMNPMKNNKK